MLSYFGSAVERAMKVQEVILRALAKTITWQQAAEIIGITGRHMRRYRAHYQKHGYEGLWDRRRGKPSPRRVPVELVERVLGLYRERYFDLNVRHFHEKLREEHGIRLSYTWVKLALQGAGLVSKGRRRGQHRRRRERRPLPGMLLHMDGSRHRWFGDERWYDLIVILEATSEIYYAQLVAEESTATVMAALRAVIQKKGLFCALYSDRGSHFWLTPKAGGAVDKQQLTQVGRATRELGIQMIPAYSPQARGRSERSFGTWQGRLPQELRLAGITTLAEANAWLRRCYVARFNRQFARPAAQSGSAFVPLCGQDLDRVFSLRHERTVANDNTVALGNLRLQLEPVAWRGALARCQVAVHQHLNGTISIFYGPRRLGRYRADGTPFPRSKKAVEKTAGGKQENPTKRGFPRFPPALEIPPKARDSHFSAAAAAARN
jgi:transposase